MSIFQNEIFLVIWKINVLINLLIVIAYLRFEKRRTFRIFFSCSFGLAFATPFVILKLLLVTYGPFKFKKRK